MSSDADLPVERETSFWLSRGLFVAGLLYPFWFALTPEGATDSLLVWCLVGVVMLMPATLAALVPALRARLPQMCAAALCVITAHFFVLANLNDMHPFYAIGTVMMGVNCALTFSQAPAFLTYICYVLLLIGITSFATSWEPVYYGPLALVLLLAYWHLNHRNRAEARLQRYREDLQRLVDDRTRELQTRTQDLAEANTKLSREIAERERAEESLRVWQRLQSVARLAGGVAHDFNNLLTTITVYSELLRDALPEDSSERGDAEEVCRAAKRATTLTSQLLAFSRDASLEASTVDLNAVVLEAQTIVHAVTGEDIDVVMDLAPSSVGVRGNRGQFEQVVANLTANARDAMPDGGVLTIETRVVAREEMPAGELPDDWSADRVSVLRMRDTGIGMDEETLQHIFDPFFTTKEVGRGTGLGLAAVYGIVQQSHGWVRAQSEPESGTCFTICWPYEEAPTDASRGHEPDAEQPEPDGARNRQILVVDDEPSLRTLVRRILTKDGFDVHLVPDAERALEALRDPKRQIDLMVTDVVLPRHNGIDLWHEATRLRPGLRVLFISGHLHHPSLSARELPSGAPLLPKPFSPHTLIDEVHAALGAPAAKPAYS